MSDIEQEIVIPSSPEDRKKIKKAMEEISGMKTKIEGARDTIKESIKKLSEDFKLPKKILNKMASTYHKNSFDKVTAETDAFEAAYDVILGAGVNTRKHKDSQDQGRAEKAEVLSEDE